MQTILIQDDPQLFRHLEDSLLRRADLRLLTAATAADLLDRSRREQPDLVVLGPGRLEAPVAEVERRLSRLPRPPICLSCAQAGGEAALLADIHRHLGVAPRRSPRRVCRLIVRLSSPAGRKRGITRDLGAGGVFVATPDPYPVATPVGLSLRAADGSTTVKASGEVVRAVGPDESCERLAGMAIQFATDAGLDPAAVLRLSGEAKATP